MERKSIPTHLRRLVVLGLLLGTSMGGLVGCGKQSFVSDIKLESIGETDDNGEEKINVKVGAQFDFGTNVLFPALEFPIKDWAGDKRDLGTFRTAPTLEGKNEISLTLNLTDAFKVPGGFAKLPNGADIPVGGLDAINIIEIPIDKINAKVYVASSNGLVMVGVAFTFKELDRLGSSVGNLNVFPQFNIKDVKGVAGIFTGDQSRETGIALFVSLRTVLSGPTPQALAYSAFYEASYKSTSSASYRSLENAMFKEAAGTAKKKKKVLRKLYRQFRGKRKKLHLHENY